eukprot:CAMPEP_0178957900 /NCGR_PEP_ID=MMETSP0789-20121207/11223_1 /TAXON_ID=3005 /ORGANISM="Rhizosolenia setigera, Strain CCMP 1694" /LENGTH=84 /DNA_ID=CAMNT_0020640305 /DNA_START=58 /DNA_END=312 /DNA_ORIENTATION=-
MKSPALLLFALALTLVAAKEPTYLRTGDGLASVLKRQLQFEWIFGSCEPSPATASDAPSSAAPTDDEATEDDVSSGTGQDGNTF